MATVTSNLSELRRLLAAHCDFSDDLFAADYGIGKQLSVDWAAFAHRPFDARSACVAGIAIGKQISRQEVLDRRELGAPVFFAVGDDHYEVWRPGRSEATDVRQSIGRRDIAAFIREHAAELNRNRLYEAKTRGRLAEDDRQTSLFVDPGVLLYAESEMGERLTSAVVDAVRLLATPRSQVSAWAFKAVFRLLAAKVLKDKQVPGFASANLLQVDKSLQRVETHYGSRNRLSIRDDARRRQLVEAVKLLNRVGDLRNLTTESLADVYERALITAETRKVHGTHRRRAILSTMSSGSWRTGSPKSRLNVCAFSNRRAGMPRSWCRRCGCCERLTFTCRRVNA